MSGDYLTPAANAARHADILEEFASILEDQEIHLCPDFACAFLGFSTLWVPADTGGREHTFACYSREKAIRILAYKAGGEDAYQEAAEVLDSSRNGFTSYTAQYILVEEVD